MALLESEPARQRRQIHSWKSIAEYLHRDVRTVQRWEKSADLPVRRLKHDSRATVFAWSDELDAWVQSRTEGGPADEPQAARRKTVPALYAVAAACVAAFLVWAAFTADGPPAAPAIPAPRPITFEPGINWGARLSPDARRIAYSRRLANNEPSAVVIRDIEDGDEIVVNATPLNEHSPAWAPSGAELAFLRDGRDGVADIVIATLPDLEERTLARLRAPAFSLQSMTGPSQLDWSPDGRFLLTTEQESPGVSPFRITLVEVSTGKRRFLTSSESVSVQAGGDLSPRWSPDGLQFLAIRRLSLQESRLDLYAFRQGAAEPLRGLPSQGEEGGRAAIKHAAWTPDGAHVVWSAVSVSAPESRLWRVSTRDGAAPEPLPIGYLRAGGSDFRETPDGRWAMAFTSAGADVDIIQIPLAREDGALRAAPQGSWRVIADSLTDDNRPTVSPDGTMLAFTSSRSGSYQIWLADLRTGATRQITNIPRTKIGDKLWSPDGENVTFIAFGPKGRDIMTVRVSDGHTRTIAKDAPQEWPVDYSLDGSTFYFLKWIKENRTLWALDVATGTATRASEPLQAKAVRVNPRGGFIQWDRQKFYARRDFESEPVFLFESTLWAPSSFVVRDSGVYFIANDQRLGYYGFDDRVVRTLVRFTKRLRAGVTVTAAEDFAYVTVLETQMQIMTVDDARGLF